MPDFISFIHPELVRVRRGMSNTVIYHLSQLRAFWQLRAVLKRASFWIEARFFRLRYNLQEEQSNYQSLQHLLRITQVQVVLAITFALVLQFVDPYLYPYYHAINLNIPDDGDYVTLLATISGIGGVFIGLYYAGISTVGGAIYARVPNNIRDLLAQERFGNVYMRFLSFVTFLCLVLVALRVLGFPRIYLAVPVATVAAGIGIISFAMLGRRMFNLFDPTALSGHIFEQLQHWLRMVKAGGFRWHDKAFQAHAHRQASSILDTLETLSDITASEPHLNGTPFIDLGKNLVRFLIHYERAKRYIPSQSNWYAQRYEHRDWYRTEDSHVAIAHHTGTALQPEVTNDKEWVEAKVTPILKRCIKVNLESARYAEVLELAGYIEAYVCQLAEEGRLKRAMDSVAELGDVILQQITSPAAESDGTGEVLEKVAIVERLASLPIATAIAYRRAMEQFSAEDNSSELSRVNWDDSRSIYRGAFPSYCLPRLEWFEPRLSFEKAIEGHSVSPLWYQSELLLQVEAEQFVDNAGALVSVAAAQYRKWIAKTAAVKRPWLSAAIISREWKYWHNTTGLIPLLGDKWESMSLGRRIEGLPWPDCDIDNLKSESRLRRNELLKQMSQEHILLALLKRPDGFPDYAGQFLHTSGEAAFDALLNNEVDLLKGIFGAYLLGCVLTFENLRPKTAATDWRAQQALKIAAAPLLDAMDISGYARLLADYHGNEELWRTISDAWDGYLDQEHAKARVQLFAAAVGLTEMPFELPHRSLLRTSWHQWIEHKLADVPRRRLSSRGWIGSDTIIDHPSPLIRIFARDPFGTFHDGIDVFIVYYLRTKKEVGDLDFGRKRRDLKEAIAREEDHYKTAEKAGDP